ncbi:hypothetical protein NOCARDAX2BIS_390035 [Nocardioides sp. AX2bis]|nr:hypothetical protein NOCARDAX2BIS_390035 [Nocardioides sp. AX2bis]
MFIWDDGESVNRLPVEGLVRG